ncbi:hypothetical protein HKD37_19G054129 [Glycine soja]
MAVQSTNFYCCKNVFEEDKIIASILSLEPVEVIILTCKSTGLDLNRKALIRLLEKAPQPKPSFPHWKKKRKRRATAIVGSTSVSSETSHTDGPNQLYTHIHDAAVGCEQIKAIVDDFHFGELRQSKSGWAKNVWLERSEHCLSRLLRGKTEREE